MTPFDVLEIDIDKFILICNYLVDLGSEKPTENTKNDKEEAAAFWAAL